MRKVEKKILTHKKCVESNMSIVKIALSCVAMATIVLPFIRKMEQVLFIMAVIFCFITALCGLVILLRTISIDKKLKAGKYFIYLDRVSDKEVDENEYSKTYRLKFKNNKYEKPVSANVYQKTKTGTLYYLIQLEGSKKAISAFAEEEYCLDESVTNRFKEK